MDLSENDISDIFVNYICDVVPAVADRSYPAEQAVLDYVDSLPSLDPTSIRALGVRLSANLDTEQLLFIVEGTRDNFMSRYQFPARAASIGRAGQKQGGYVDTLLVPGVIDMWWLYGGCSFGRSGVRNRVWNEHENENFRRRNPCYHYRLVEEGAQMNFVCAALFDVAAPPAEVLLTESGIVNIIGSLPNDFHLRHRDPRLPVVSPLRAVNRQEPLLTNDMSALQRAMSLEKRQALLRKGLDGGIFLVTQKSTKNSGHDWTFKLSGIQINIPRQIARDLELKAHTPVDIKFILNDTVPNANRWADAAIEYDDGYKLCIEISREIRGTMVTRFLTKAHTSAVAQANALYDWLMGEIHDIDTMTPGDWGWDRYPFCGPFRDVVSKETWAEVFADPIRRKLRHEHGEARTVTWQFLNDGEAEVEEVLDDDLLEIPDLPGLQAADNAFAARDAAQEVWDRLLSEDDGARHRWGGENVRIRYPGSQWRL